MNIDKKIRQELAREQQQVNATRSQDPTLFGMLGDAYKGRLGGWMILMSFIAVLLSGLMLWSGYQFFFVVESEAALIKWGVTLLLSSMMQIAIKMWTFNEMNRNAIQREIKRLEVAIEKRDQG
ncbi:MULTISPECIES: DUF6768 family protein [Shewanella]|jgi:cytochrome b subunit of formate dehydrogenase|uniref:DUF6768 family protein n=1 Tax=Shewanella TaxID=22 RepID=UPI000C7A319F|nr:MULTISPECIES: DUF6768 family protein [Shewanella]MCL1057707.1 hypothetical protein [Shewanella gelidimarina]PKG58312.1 hypothetical protein CXF82_05165 [Shewanella sp. GutDb-MelDb]PKG75029.1 hypothetical protein CXF86_08525 [Shewanella sp. GutCb]